MSKEEKQQRKKKLLPVWALIPMDAALIAANLLTFAYFHHVNPVHTAPEHVDIGTSFVPPENPRTSRTTTVADGSTTAGEQGTDIPQQTDGSENGTTADSQDTTGGLNTTTRTTGEQGGSETQSASAGSESGSKTSSTTTVTTTAPVLKPDLSGWGAKWPDKFSYDDTIIANDSLYKSHDMNITLEKKQVGNSVAYVADIYLRYYDNFMAGVGSDTYSRSSSDLEYLKKFGDRKNAVLAVNGDFFAQRDEGIYVRNFKVERNVPFRDVGCLYYDGTFKTIAKDDFDLETELKNGLYHTMTFGPALVQNGTAETNISSSVSGTNPRTGFGYYEPGHYTLVVVDGRQEGYSEGLTLDEFAAFFTDLGCKEAFNLDGGASSIMYFNGKIVNSQSKYRSSSDIFYFAEVE